MQVMNDFDRLRIVILIKMSKVLTNSAEKLVERAKRDGQIPKSTQIGQEGLS